MSHTITELFTGQTACIQRTFTEEDVKLCNELTRDYSLVYEPNNNVWKTFYPKPLVPGILTEGLINQAIYEKLPGSASILLQKELIFYLPVYIDDTISAKLEIININLERNWVTQKVTCYNQSGNVVVKGQVVILVLPNQG